MKLQVQKFIAVMEEKTLKKEPVNVANWFTYLAFDIMGDLCFAEPFGCLDQAANTEWSTSVINVFVSATWTQGIRRLSGTGTWLESLMTWLLVPAKAAEWRRTHLNNSRERTLRRLASSEQDHADFIYHILNSEGKSTLSHNEVILNVALMISAGTDTTATALTGWTYFVCTHPEVYRRLIDEVRGGLPTEDHIRWENVRKMSYLEATIHEALRLYPPSPASQQRVVPGAEPPSTGILYPRGRPSPFRRGCRRTRRCIFTTPSPLGQRGGWARMKSMPGTTSTPRCPLGPGLASALAGTWPTWRCNSSLPLCCGIMTSSWIEKNTWT
ncbi:Cytochrome P450 monooxygenase abl2 [Pyricularia oryzae]|nr:Cytochrome P450 monooxygenase abl2 [Pyricularia oryzae]